MPLFRVAHHIAVRSRESRNVFWKCGIVFRVFYLVVVVWILGVELHDEVCAGPGLIIYHGQALVVNGTVILGANCILRQSTTIGWTTSLDGVNSKAPILGDNVDVGAQAVIIGPIMVGSNARIGAGSVVVKDVPPGAVVVGNPSRIVKYLSGFDPSHPRAL